MRTILSVALMVSCLSACGKKKETPGETAKPGSGTATAPATGSAATGTPPATGTPGGKGMAAAGNDAAVVALFKAAVACKVDEDGSLDSECPAMKALGDSKAFEDGKADVTLLNLIEDPSDKVRLLAWDKVGSEGGEKTYKDKAVVGRILDAAEAEKTEANLGEVGKVVSKIDVKESGTFDRVKKLFASAGKPRKKEIATLVGSAYNTKNDEVWAWHKSLLNDADADVRKAAIGAYFGNPSNLRRPEVCVIYGENFGHADPVVAAKAMGASSGSSECIGDLDKAIAEVEKRGKAGQIPSDATDMLTVLSDPFKNPKVTPAHVKKKQDVAKGIALNTKLPDNIRRGALERVNEVDPAAGKALAKTLLADKAIGDYAKSVAEKK